jgi:hypothetical protein
MNYIKKEQLEKIVAQQKELAGVLNSIGLLEAQKHGALHQLAGLNEDIEKFKSELEQEYGPINISLEDGSYTKVDESGLKVVTDESN